MRSAMCSNRDSRSNGDETSASDSSSVCDDATYRSSCVSSYTAVSSPSRDEAASDSSADDSERLGRCRSSFKPRYSGPELPVSTDACVLTSQQLLLLLAADEDYCISGSRSSWQHSAVSPSPPVGPTGGRLRRTKEALAAPLTKALHGLRTRLDPRRDDRSPAPTRQPPQPQSPPSPPLRVRERKQLLLLPPHSAASAPAPRAATATATSGSRSPGTATAARNAAAAASSIASAPSPASSCVGLITPPVMCSGGGPVCGLRRLPCQAREEEGDKLQEGVPHELHWRDQERIVEWVHRSGRLGGW